MTIITKIISIASEGSTLTVATYDKYEIEVFPLPKGSLTETDGWAYAIREIHTPNDVISEDESTLFSSSRIALISALSTLMEDNQ